MTSSRPLRLGRSRLAPDRLAWVGLALLLAGALLSPAPGVAAGIEPAERGRVEAFVREWRAAWEAQDAERLLALHAPDFRSGARDRAAFTAHKRSLFARGVVISVEVGDLDVSLVTVEREELLRARFQQVYSSPTLNDTGRKELLLRRVGSGLLVVSEGWSAGGGAIRVPLDRTQPAARVAAPITTPPSSPRRGDQEVPAPVLGRDYVPPAVGERAAAGVDDLLDLRPLVADQPAFLPPIQGLPADDGDRQVIEEVVARVNGRVLTRSMLLDRLLTFQDQLVREAPPDLDRRLAGLVPETIQTTIDRWLLLEEASHRNADLESFWREWLAEKRRVVGATDLSEFEALLSEQGLTLPQLKELVIEQEVPNLFVQSVVTTAIDTSDAAQRSWYAAHPDTYRVPARVNLRQILLPAPTPADEQRALAAADHVLQALTAGADWCDQHAVYGEGTAPCGEVGLVAIDDLAPELRAAAGGLPIGAVSRPIRSALGIHLLVITERIEGAPLPFAEVQERVRKDLLDSEFEQRFDALLVDLRAGSQVEVNPRYDKSAVPDGGVSQ